MAAALKIGADETSLQVMQLMREGSVPRPALKMGACGL
jgi:hypothetical protein